MKNLIDPKVFNFHKLDFLSKEEIQEITNFTLLRQISSNMHTELIACLLTCDSYIDQMASDFNHYDYRIFRDEFNHFHMLRRYLLKKKFPIKDMMLDLPLYRMIKWMPIKWKRIFVFFVEKYIGMNKFQFFIDHVKDPELKRIYIKFAKDEKMHVESFEKDRGKTWIVKLFLLFFDRKNYLKNHIKLFYVYNKFEKIKENLTWKQWTSLIQSSPYLLTAYTK